MYRCCRKYLICKGHPPPSPSGAALLLVRAHDPASCTLYPIRSERGLPWPSLYWQAKCTCQKQRGGVAPNAESISFTAGSRSPRRYSTKIKYTGSRDINTRVLVYHPSHKDIDEQESKQGTKHMGSSVLRRHRHTRREEPTNIITVI